MDKILAVSTVGRNFITKTVRAESQVTPPVISTVLYRLTPGPAGEPQNMVIFIERCPRLHDRILSGHF